MVATLTWGGDAIGMACATGFTLAMQARRCRSGRIEFNRIDMLFWAGLFASGCSPRRLSAAQSPSATQTFHVSSALGLSPVSCIVFISAHSPAFQRRERPIPHRPSPGGTAENPVIHPDKGKRQARSPMRENQNKVAMKYAIMRAPAAFTTPCAKSDCYP
jgi:hypothetical protein